jgi:hypothetical protein
MPAATFQRSSRSFIVQAQVDADAKLIQDEALEGNEALAQEGLIQLEQSF